MTAALGAESQTVIGLTAPAAIIAIAMTLSLWALVESSRPIANMPVAPPQMIAVAGTRPQAVRLEAVEEEERIQCDDRGGVEPKRCSGGKGCFDSERVVRHRAGCLLSLCRGQTRKRWDT